MGPSGAGKTTLLNALAYRLTSAKLKKGARLLNDRPYNGDVLRNMAGFVEQLDVLAGGLTVDETLRYAAELLLPADWTAAQRAARVDDVVADMRLERARSTLVGDHNVKGLSGGEKKRLSCALALLRNPRLIFLDEPTSGLDSATSLALCELLKNLATARRVTVAATLHQPSSKIVALFDRAIMLAPGGHVAYQGAWADSVAAFAAAGHPVPPLVNPANHFMAVLTRKGAESLRLSPDPEPPAALGGKSKLLLADADGEGGGVAPAFERSQRMLPWHRQVWVLVRRNALDTLRNWRTFLLQTAISAFTACMLAGYNIPDEISGLRLRGRVVYFGVQNQGYYAAMGVLNSFPAERALQLRERAAGQYGTSPYYLARILVDTLKFMPAPIAFSLCLYWWAGLQNTASNFFIFVATLMLITAATTALASGLTSVCRRVSLAVVMLPLVIDLARLFSGFYVVPSEQSWPWKFFDYTSYLWYGNNMVLMNEFNGLYLGCTPEQQQAAAANGTACPAIDASTYINAKGYADLTIAENAACLFAYLAFFHAAGYIGLRFLKT